MREVCVHLKDRTYSIFVEVNGLQKIGDPFYAHNVGDPVAVISDETVSRLYGQGILDALEGKGIGCALYRVPDGESSKSDAQVSQLYTRLIQSNLRRDGCIIAFGGGVVGDLAGFVAATYLRGIDWIQVPTTLLAQVDASVGGKVGINHPMGKNLIGSFYQPRFVLIDPFVLTTLTKRELWAGMGEVVKYALIHNGDLLSVLENKMETLIELEDMDAVTEMIILSCSIKSEIVQQDERERGLRRILNFGHTLGHALETETGYAYFRHGEAIVHGMHWASWVSWQKGFLSESHFKRIETLLKRIPAPVLPKTLRADRLALHIASDKKQSREGLNFVLLEDIGRPVVVKEEAMEALIEKWLKFESG